jgi:GH18 family chitinase
MLLSAAALAASSKTSWIASMFRTLAWIIAVVLSLLLFAEVSQHLPTRSKLISTTTKWLSSAVSTPTIPARKSSSTAETLMLAGFLPEYRMDSRNLSYLCTKATHVVLFSLEIDARSGALAETSRFNSIMRDQLPNSKCKRVMLAVGGAGRSQGFSLMTADPKKRYAFTRSFSSQYYHEMSIVGVELNWQFPSTVDELRNLKLLVTEMQQALPRWKFSMAIPPTEYLAEGLRAVGLHRLFDVFHVMTYQSGVGGGEDVAKARVIDAISNNVGKHLFVGNLTVGVAFFYGSKSGQVFSYEQFLELNDREVKNKHGDGPRQMPMYVQLAKQLGLRGISIWELGQDCRVAPVGQHKRTCPNGAEDSLLEALSSAVVAAAV